MAASRATPGTGRQPFASSMWVDGDAEWGAAVAVVDARRLRSSWRVAAGLVREGFRRDVLILHGAVPARLLYRDLVAALVVRWTSRRCHLLITDATWTVGSAAMERRFPALRRWVPALARAAIRLLDSDRTHYCVLSSHEREQFASTWGVDPARVHFTPFPHTLYDEAEREPTGTGDYLFSGGDSLRDYDLLVESCAGLPVELRVAARWRPARPRPGISVSTTTHQGFVELLRGCRACVVPLRAAERSAGQQTYLNAMLLGKPVVVTEAPGVRDYVRDGVTGVVVPAHRPALRAAVEHLLDPANTEHYAAMGAAARADVLARFTPERYRRSLLELAGRISSAPPARPRLRRWGAVPRRPGAPPPARAPRPARSPRPPGPSTAP